MDNLEKKINSLNKNFLGNDIINDLQKIINYINENILMKQKENDDEINLDGEDSQNEEIEFLENKKETKIKLGKKRKKDNLSEKSDDDEEKLFDKNETNIIRKQQH